MLSNPYKTVLHINAEKTRALREHRPPWPRHLITPIMSPIFCLDSFTIKYLHTVIFQALWEHKFPPRPNCDPDHYQYLIICSHPRPLHKKLLQSVHNILSNVANRQTNKQTNATETITSSARRWQLLGTYTSILVNLFPFSTLLEQAFFQIKRIARHIQLQKQNTFCIKKNI